MAFSTSTHLCHDPHLRDKRRDAFGNRPVRPASPTSSPSPTLSLPSGDTTDPAFTAPFASPRPSGANPPGASLLRVLQAGRALAAISVAAFHLSILMGLERYGGDAAFRDFTRHGFRGVDFFFVLSGFIILFAHLDDVGRPSAWKDYLNRRFVRVFPIYWLYTAGFVALLLLGFGTDAEFPTSPRDWLTTWTLVRFSAVEPPLSVAWTLFHEVAFYAMFSLLILNKRLGIIALAIWACLCIVFYDYPLEAQRTPWNVYTAGYNLFFLFGMAACWLYRRGGDGFVEFGAGLAIAIVAGVTMGLPDNLSPLILAVGFALLVAGATKMERGGYINVPGFLNYIGNASYTIYLAHIPILGLLMKVALASGLYGAVGARATYIIVLSTTIASGCAAYALVEKPLLAFLRRRSAKRARSAAARATPAAG
jgi:peptidoglycan/LPS O-acetylase OafA/YrhL